MKPNILFIMTDQHSYDCLSCMGHPLVETPHIDRLAQQGILFRNSYVPSPVCGPSRGAVFSGQYPLSCGSTGNPARFKDHVIPLPEMLSGEGYQTASVGKLHFAPPENSWGFESKQLHDSPYNVHAPDADHSDYIRWLRNTPLAAQVDGFVDRFNADEESFATDISRFIMGGNFIPEAFHMTTWTADRSIDFLKSRDPGRPFMLFSSFFGPHQPWDPPAPWNTRYDPADVDLPCFEAPSGGCPYFDTRFPESYRTSAFGNLSGEDYRRFIAAYYGSIAMIDHHIGRMLDTLEAEGLWDDTLIVFTSDHGDHQGRFGLFFKSSMYENAVRTPLIMKPVKGGPSGVEVSDSVNTLDLYGTLGDVAGNTDWRSGPVEGGSLFPFLQGDMEAPARPVFSVLGKQTMLRRGHLKLIRIIRKDGAFAYELFNLEADPQERTNCMNVPEYQEAVAALKAELDAWSERQNWE